MEMVKKGEIKQRESKVKDRKVKQCKERKGAYIRKKSKYKKVGVLPIRIVKSNISSVGPSSERIMFLSDEGPTLQTLDFTFHIGSTPTLLYFDLYLEGLKPEQPMSKNAILRKKSLKVRLQLKIQNIEHKQ